MNRTASPRIPRALAAAAVALAAWTFAPPLARAQKVEPKTDDEKAFYALGAVLAKNAGTFQLTAKEKPFVAAGFTDALDGKKIDTDGAMQKLQALAAERSKLAAAEEKNSSKAFLEKAAAEKGAVKSASGLIYQETQAGSGPSPKPTDTVKVHYTGTLTDGTVFDSSVKRGEPATFPLNGVIPCWTEGVQKMKVGGKAKLICPSDIAYGDRGMPPTIKPGSTLVFEVELLEIPQAK